MLSGSTDPISLRRPIACTPSTGSRCLPRAIEKMRLFSFRLLCALPLQCDVPRDRISPARAGMGLIQRTYLERRYASLEPVPFLPVVRPLRCQAAVVGIALRRDNGPSLVRCAENRLLVQGSDGMAVDNTYV